MGISMEIPKLTSLNTMYNRTGTTGVSESENWVKCIASDKVVLLYDDDSHNLWLHNIKKLEKDIYIYIYIITIL